MTKKIFFAFILLLIVFNISPPYEDALSQSKYILRATRKNDEIFIHVLTSLNTKQIKVEIINIDGLTKSVIFRDYFAIRNYLGKQHNEYIISSKYNDIVESDKILIYNNAEVVAEYEASSIPYFMTEGIESNETKKIRIMTYNIHRGRDKIGNNNLKNISKLIEYYDVDIVGLQEVDKNVSRTNFEDQLKILAEELSMYYYFGSNKSFLKGEYGNGVLSKYPLQSPENIIFQGREPRGLLKTSILLGNNKKMNFMVTHLGLDIEERQKQFNNVLNYIDVYDENLVLVGDFNVLDNDPNIMKIQKHLNDVGEKTINRYVNTLNIFRNEHRIDYVFVNKRMQIKKYKVEKVQYSDHFPIIVDIEF